MNTGSVPRGRGRGRKPETSSTSTASSSSPSSGPDQAGSQLAQLSMSENSSSSQIDGKFASRRGPRSDTAVGFKEVPKQSIVERKQGSGGTTIDLLSNYFMMERAPNWQLFQYHVVFNPAVDHKKQKRGILWQKRETFGPASVFDGSTLTTFKEIPDDELVLTVPDKKNSEQVYQITLTHVSTLKSGDYSFLQFYNNIVRKCLFQMKMTEVGRNFFDSNKAIMIPKYRITLWPGFVTSIRQHDGGLMMCVEGTTKVLRTDTVLKTLDDLKNQFKGIQYEDAVKRKISGQVVLSIYNNKTYTIADIDFGQNPLSTFDKKGEQLTYVEYYRTRYEQEIKEMRQPLLVVEPRKQDFHRQGHDPSSSGPCLLVPELCRMTGLTDEMRGDSQLMKELGKYLFQAPEERVDNTLAFMNKLQTTPENKEELDSWGIKFNPNLVHCPGRILTPESIIFASNSERVDGKKADWTSHFQGKKQMLSTVKLDHWAIIVPQRNGPEVDPLIQMLKKVATQLNFHMEKPIVIETITTANTSLYLAAIKKVVSANPQLQMVFVILVQNALANYGAVKKALSVTYGLPSQCFLAKNLKSRNSPVPSLSVVTKVAIQMNAKLGGEPWSVPIRVKKMMVIGFDAYHGSAATGGKSVGAVVATTGDTMASFFSCVSFHADGAELARNLSANIIKCVEAYKGINGSFPERIMLYRDGVGDGQLEFVQETEVKQLLEVLEGHYSKANQSKPKLTYTIVCKKVNTRLFTADRKNPQSGTVCDDVCTLPERYDFFLVPQTARQGAVSPSSYNVIYDSQGLKPERIQAFTYKMCHLYFNWSGTVAVPAPIKYAHKLASQVGTAIGAAAHDQLAFKLHYL